MPPKPKMKLESRFPAAKEAAHDCVRQSRDEALASGIDETRKRIGKARTAHDYDLDPFVVEKEKTGFQSGRIFVPADKWYYKFFEFGTTYIAATPFIRPAHRKMRAVFRDQMGDNFERFVSKKASVNPKGVGK